MHASAQSHKELVAGVVALAGRVQADRQLAALVRRKFAIKCTTGYSLNALVDFPLSDPIEIIKRLLIGSEGTLGFVSQGTYNTVPEWPHKARAFGCWVGEAWWQLAVPPSASSVVIIRQLIKVWWRASSARTLTTLCA